MNIFPEASSFGSQFAKSLGGGIGQGLSNSAETAMKLMSKRAEEKKVGDALTKFLQGNGDLGNLPQEFQKQILQSNLDQNKAKRSPEQQMMDEENYEKVKNAFGPKLADLWKASGAGAQTKLINTAVDAASRGVDLDELLGSTNKTNVKKNEVPLKEGKIPAYSLDTKGMNLSDKVKYQTALRNDNTPIWKSSVDRRKSFNELGRDIKILEGINNKKNLPEKFGKLLINPETGAPYETVTAFKDMHPDVQQWVKTIARQATQAQQSFPGRVTNFDLSQYMRQFPSLFNTHEGRQIILKQMNLVNEAHKLFEDALGEVYNKYKLNGITPEDAQDIAEKMTEKKRQEIDDRLLQLSDDGEALSQHPHADKQAKSRTIDVMGPDGQEYEIDESQLDQLPEGYRLI